MELPYISVIIPIREFKLPNLPVLQSVYNVDYPKDKFELIVVEGNNPPYQRNLGAEAAKGEILFFLDDDCCFTPDLFKNIVKFYIEDDSISGVGGVALASEDAPFSSKLTKEVFASFFGGNIIRKRHTKGKNYIIPAEENALILCNFSIKRDVFLKEGGFSTFIYPGEENEFLLRLNKKKHIFCLTQNAVVTRMWKKNLWDILTSIFNYGKSRMLMLTKFKRRIKIFYFAPLFFLVYLFILFLGSINLIKVPLFLPYILVIYLLGAAFSSLFIALKNRKFSYLLVFFFFPLVHILYGLGELFGLVGFQKKSYKRENKAIVIKLKNFVNV